MRWATRCIEWRSRRRVRRATPTTCTKTCSCACWSDEHLKAWLLRVTINRCHDIARLSWNRRTGGLEQEHIDIPAPDAFRADIWEVVGALPPDLRTTVHLHYAEGYSTEEIARIAGCKPSTVRTRLHRARERLRTTLLDEQLEQAGSIESRKEPDHGRTA